MKWFWYCIAGSFSFDEYKARKILLCSDNQPHLIELITKALESYDAWQKERGKPQIRTDSNV